MTNKKNADSGNYTCFLCKSGIDESSVKGIEKNFLKQ